MRALMLALIVAAVQAVAATAQELSWSSSLQLASGTYIFTEPTRTLSLNNGLTLTTDRVRLGASLPLILQNSGAITVVGGAALPTGGEDHGDVGQRQGGQKVPMGHGGSRNDIVATDGYIAALVAPDSVVEEPGTYTLHVGDPYFSAAVELYEGFGLVRALEVTASSKAPLNDLESGVGTGEWDVAAGGAAVLGLGPVLAFLDASHWWYGDLPELELRDGWNLGVGLGAPLTRRLWVSAMATRGNQILATAEAPASVSAGLSWRTTLGTVSAFAGTGLSETAADFTVSLGWQQSLGR